MNALPKGGDFPSTKPKLVKSLLKGLGCLSLVNKHNGISVADVAAQLKIPKSTAYRVLETLCRGGYIVRETDGQYRATSLVRTLSAGFDEEEWVLTIAHPELTELGQRLVWGVGIATPAGLSMRIRETTDRDSPLTIDRYSAGTLLPLDCSGAGQIYLAYLPEPESKRCIEVLSQGALRADSPLHAPAVFEAHLAKIREQGFAICQLSPKESAVSVPILVRGRCIACIGMHFIRRALSDERIEAEFIPLLRVSAHKIQNRLIEKNYEFSEGRATCKA